MANSFKIDDVTVQIGAGMKELGKDILPLALKLGGDKGSIDTTRDALGSMAGEIMLRVIAASQFLKEKCIPIRGSRYNENNSRFDRDKFKAALLNKLSPSVGAGVQIKSDARYDAHWPELGACYVIECCVSLLWDLCRLKDRESASMDELLSVARQFAVIETISATLNLEGVEKHAISKTQAERRAHVKAENLEKVKQELQNFLETHQLKNYRKLSGELNFSLLASHLKPKLKEKGLSLNIRSIRAYLKTLKMCDPSINNNHVENR